MLTPERRFYEVLAYRDAADGEPYTRDTSTRKADALTVGDVLENREYATAEMLADLTGGAVHIAADVLDAMRDAALSLSDAFDGLERTTVEVAADLWGAIAEDGGNPQR